MGAARWIRRGWRDAALAQDEVPTFTVDTREVDLYTSAWATRTASRFPAFRRSAFKVFENGVEQPIKAFNPTGRAGFRWAS